MMANEKIFSQIVVTNANRLSDLSIGDAQLVFIRDKSRIAFDFNGTRTFYNEITTLATEQERTSLLNPVVEHFYFIAETMTLWTYQDTGWVRLTHEEKEVIYFLDSLPESGSEDKLYVNKKEKTISIWDDETQEFSKISGVDTIQQEDIIELFN